MNEILIAALQNIASRGATTMPEEPEFNSTQDAENFGADYTSFELAEIARAALAAAGVSLSQASQKLQLVQDVMMQDIVGDYDVPSQVPEWAWVEKNASFRHVSNGESGVWDFMLNLSRTFDEAPPRLQAVIDAARKNGFSYILFNQGT